MKSVVTPTAALIAFVVILAGLAWWLAAPRGELRLALDASIQGDADRTAVAAELFQRADSLVDEAQSYHERLSLSDPNDAVQLVAMPPTERPGGHALQQLITAFVAEVAVDQGSGRVALSIDGVAVLEALYDFVGWRDYFLAISRISEVDCPGSSLESSESSPVSADESSPASSDAACYEVAAHFSPSEQRTEILRGTTEGIARDLAVLVLRGVVRDREIAYNAANADSNAPDPYLFAGSIPRRMAALEVGARGIDVLLEEQHPQCRDMTHEACRTMAKTLLNQAVGTKKGGVVVHPMAAFGLTLIAVEEGLSAAQAHKAGSIVEASLHEADFWMAQAVNSEFIRERLSDESFVGQFDGLKLGGGILDESFFDNLGDFVCTLDAYNRADWQECIQRVGEIGTYPEPLRPYLEAATLYAELQRSEGADRSGVLDRIESRLIEIANSPDLSQEQRQYRRWPLQRVIVLDACVKPGSVTKERFMELATALQFDAPDLEAFTIAKIEVSGCQFAPPEGTDAGITELAEEADELEDEEFRNRLEFALAKYYARTGDFDRALERLKKAVPLYYVNSYVKKAPEFAGFMRSRRHAGAFFEAYFKQWPSLAGLPCQQDLL